MSTRTFVSNLSQCENDEVLVGVQILPVNPAYNRTSQPGYADDGFQMAALCRRRDGSVRTVVPGSRQLSTSFDVNSSKVSTVQQICGAGDYGTGVGFVSDGNVLGVQLRCDTSAPPSQSSGNMGLTKAPGGGVNYIGDGPGVANQRNRASAEVGRINSRDGTACVVQ